MAKSQKCRLRLQAWDERDNPESPLCWSSRHADLGGPSAGVSGTLDVGCKGSTGQPIRAGESGGVEVGHAEVWFAIR